MAEFSEELKTRLSLQREHVSPIDNGDFTKKRRPPTVFNYITPESSPQEVREWMLVKGFEPV